MARLPINAWPHRLCTPASPVDSGDLGLGTTHGRPRALSRTTLLCSLVMRHLALGGSEHQQHHSCGSREGRHHLYAASMTETEASLGPQKSPSAHNKGIERS
ncbi:unnamed protein product [Urochloa humidicola]